MLAKSQNQEHDIALKNQKIAQLLSKMVAAGQILSQHLEDENVNNNTSVPIIVKVESIDTDNDVATQDIDTRIPGTRMTRAANVCNVCDKKFSSGRALRSHLILHDPSIPCPKCPMKFGRSDYLQRHLKRAHDEGLIRHTTSYKLQVGR